MEILRQESVPFGRTLTVMLQLFRTDDPQWPYSTALVDPDTEEKIWQRHFVSLEAATNDFIHRLAEYQ